MKKNKEKAFFDFLSFHFFYDKQRFMANIIEQATKYRIKQIEIAEAEYYQQLTKVLDKIEDDIASLANKMLPTTDGKLINLQQAIAIRPQIKAILEKHYLPFADRVVRQGFSKQALRVEKAFKAIGFIPPEFQELTKGDLALVKNLKQQYFTQFKDISNTFTRTLSDKVYQNTLLGSEFTELEKELRQSINGIYSSSNDPQMNKLVDYVKRNKDDLSKATLVDKAVKTLQTKFGADRAGNNMKRYAGQLLNDSLRDFDATLNFNKSKDAGLTYVKYYGDIIPTTRQICRSLVSGSLNKRKNGLFTIDEVKSMWSSRSWSGKKSGNPLVVRGGYNCRHQWSFVNPDWYEDEEVLKTKPLVPTPKEKKSTSIFGSVSEEESSLLPIAFGATASNFTRMVNKLPKLPPIKKGSPAYRYFTDEIRMPITQRNISKNLKDKYMFTHEYGHRIDHKLAQILHKDKKLAEKFMPTLTTDATLGEGVISGATEYQVQISNIAKKAVMADRVVIKNNIKKALGVMEQEKADLAKVFLGKDGFKKIKIKVEDIIKSKEFPLTIDEVTILLREQGMVYDPADLNTVQFVLQIKHKLLHSEYGKWANYTINNEVQKLSLRQINVDAWRTNGNLHFADYVGAISNNEMGFGHTLGYYKKSHSTGITQRGYGTITNRHTTEAFANYTSLSNSEHKAIYKKLMKHYAPNTTSGFDAIMERSNLL